MNRSDWVNPINPPLAPFAKGGGPQDRGIFAFDETSSSCLKLVLCLQFEYFASADTGEFALTRHANFEIY